MKRIIFTIFLSFFAFSISNAQTSETINELTPVPSNVGKFSGKLPKGHNYYESPVIEFDAKVEFIDLPNNKKGIAVTIQTTYEELVFASVGNKPTARIDIYGRITSKDKKINGFFEEKLVITATSEDLTNGKKTPVILRKVFELPDGKYQIAILVRDFASGNRGIKVIKFTQSIQTAQIAR